MSSISQAVASKLLEAEAIKIQPSDPFTWASGWKSPIYCDNRKSLSYPAIRTFIKEQLVIAVKEKFPEVEAIAGVATAGIPQGALIAEELGLPFLYVRSKPKGHGMENMIEGTITKGQKVVLVEDLISTGGSSIKAGIALKENEFEVLGLIAIFSYAFDLATKNFEAANIPFEVLSTYPDLLDLLLSENKINAEELEELKSWKEDPSAWRA